METIHISVLGGARSDFAILNFFVVGHFAPPPPRAPPWLTGIAVLV